MSRSLAANLRLLQVVACSDGRTASSSAGQRRHRVEQNSFGDCSHARSSASHDSLNSQLAILHAAIYDAVNNIEPTYTPYLVRIPDFPRSASKMAAADQAAHDVLVSLYPPFQAPLDAELQQDFAQLPDNERKAQGAAVGQAVAAQLLAARALMDKCNSPPYIGNQPGDYQLTPPNFAPADFTSGSGHPFARHGPMYSVGPPPALTSDRC